MILGIEVKGTRKDGKVVDISANEVNTASVDKKWRLTVVSNIKVNSKIVASGGNIKIYSVADRSSLRKASKKFLKLNQIRLKNPQYFAKSGIWEHWEGISVEIHKIAVFGEIWNRIL